MYWPNRQTAVSSLTGGGARPQGENMIEALLNVPAVDQQIARLLEETKSEIGLLKTGDGTAQARAEEASGSKQDLEQLDHELDEYRKKEAKDLSGSNEPVWIPRDPVASLVLS